MYLYMYVPVIDRVNDDIDDDGNAIPRADPTQGLSRQLTVIAPYACTSSRLSSCMIIPYAHDDTIHLLG
jgi:hypothetical protein